MPPFRTLAALLIGMSLAACMQSAPTNYYTLKPTDPQASSTNAAAQPMIGLEQITLPPSLVRSEVVLTTDSNELDVTATDAWAGPLNQIVTLVVAEDLATHLAVDQVLLLPVRRLIELDRIIELDIVALDAFADGEVRLSVLWRLFDDRGRLRSSGRIEKVESFEPGTTVDPAIAAINRAVAAMTIDLAAAVRAS